MPIVRNLVVIFVSFLVIAVGRSVVEWICTNVFFLEYEATDQIAGYYVMIATVVCIIVLCRWWILNRRERRREWNYYN